MKLDEIFHKKKSRLSTLKSRRIATGANHKRILECSQCAAQAEREELAQNHWICKNCGAYFALDAQTRIEMVCDKGSFHEMNRMMATGNPLAFPDYEKKLKNLRKKNKTMDAFTCGIAKIEGIAVAIGVLDSHFLMGSMGTAVGEKIARLAEKAGKKNLPLVIFSASGGARMQEGLFSLMQMSKTAAAIHRFREDGGLFVSFLTHPTTGGVSASYASLGDIMLAEPDALIGFAGPRVIEQTIGRKLPEGFQRAEFLLEHGMIDDIVKREEIRTYLGRILKMYRKGKQS